eukprot:66498-Chlamydomonas_euryale.AAC.1
MCVFPYKDDVCRVFGALFTYVHKEEDGASAPKAEASAASERVGGRTSGSSVQGQGALGGGGLGGGSGSTAAADAGGAAGAAAAPPAGAARVLDGFRLQPEEVEWARWMPLDEVRKDGAFRPVSACSQRRWSGRAGCPWMRCARRGGGGEGLGSAQPHNCESAHARKSIPSRPLDGWTAGRWSTHPHGMEAKQCHTLQHAHKGWPLVCSTQARAQREFLGCTTQARAQR